MRRLIGMAVLAIASCAPQADTMTAAHAPFPITTETLLNQGWSAADRATFTGTPQGSYLMPLPWFKALQRTDADASFAADQLGRYGYLPAAATPANPLPLPVGFVRDGTADDPQLGMTCAACHTGQLRAKGIVWRIDGGRANADFQSLLTDLGAASRATLTDPVRFNAFAVAVLGPSATPAQAAQLRQQFTDWLAQYDGFMTASLPDPPWGPGRLDAFGMIFNRVTGLDLAYPANMAKADAPVRYPFIWDAPRQDHTQWTGAAPNGTYLRGLARNTGEVFGVFGRLDPQPIPIHTAIYRNSVNLPGLQALEERVVALRAPPWPRATFLLDEARVSRGAVVFQSECASCHGLKPSPVVEKAWDTPVRNVGTDRRAFDNSQRVASPRALTGTQQPPFFGEWLTDPSPKLSILANSVIGSLLDAAVVQDPAIRRAIDRDLTEGRLPRLNRRPSAAPQATAANVKAATKDLYKTPKQEPGAAYEARVLTGIWAVGPYLHNGSVPTLAELLKPAHDRMTRFAVGHQDFDPVNVGIETSPKPGRTMFVVNPNNGNDNTGHEYGTSLPDADRWALIEYLKTL